MTQPLLLFEGTMKMAKAKNNSGPDFRIEEAIWGHRLHNEQAGPMVAMEFLNVLVAKSFKDYEQNQVVPKAERTLQYQAYRKVALRALLFNNSFIETVNKDEEDVWDQWLEIFAPIELEKSQKKAKTRKTTRELIEDSLQSGKWDDQYLRRALSNPQNSNSFEAFSSLIKLIRACSFNVNSDKRWTSMFVFPWGRDCLFVEMNDKGSTDRRFFGRSGELLYILLSYAKNRHELESLIRQKYFETDHPLNKACAFLQGREPEKAIDCANSIGPAYYTQTMQRRVDLLCDDLIRILKSSLPAEDLFSHVWRIIGLHLMCYFIERGVEASTNAFYDAQEIDPTVIQDSFHFFCEILAPCSDSIRVLSHRSFQDNSRISEKAIKKYVEKMYEKALVSSNLIDNDDDDERANFNEFFFDLLELTTNKRQSYSGTFEPKDLKERVLQDVKKRHNEHWAKVFSAYGKAIGFVSKLGTIRNRYCPTDDFIMTLILANVDDERILLNDFLTKLFDKYHIVISNLDEGKNFELNLNNDDLKDNLERLKMRLKGLGLLNTLSDGFDFVQNNFFVHS